MRTWIVAITALLCGCGNSDVSRALGARCDVSAECDTKCLPPSQDWPGGFCTLLCDNDAGCPEGARCIAEAGGVCAFSCADDPSCAFLDPGYVCKQRDSKAGGAKVLVCRGD